MEEEYHITNKIDEEAITTTDPDKVSISSILFMGPRGAIHVNHLQAPCRAFLQWDLSWREHVNVTYSYVISTRF